MCPPPIYGTKVWSSTYTNTQVVSKSEPRKGLVRAYLPQSLNLLLFF